MLGPVLMTVGPWRPVSLHAYTARVSDLHAAIDVAEDLSIKSNITFEINGTNGDNLQATYNLITSEGATILKGPIVIENGKAQAAFETSSESIQLWYPVGYGKQTLYSLQVSLCDEASNCRLYYSLLADVPFHIARKCR